MNDGELESILSPTIAAEEDTADIGPDRVCDGCLFGDPVDGIEVYVLGLPRSERRLCRVCAETHFGGLLLSLVPGSIHHRAVMSIAYSVNLLRKDLERKP
jgi:hypothetical protein